MGNDDFYKETTGQSEAKIRIVSGYVSAWARAVMPSARRGIGKIAYVDLYAGQGCYDDGTKSIPILVLERTVCDSSMRDMLVSVFNDKDKNAIACLRQSIMAIPGIDTLRYAPRYETQEVGQQITQLIDQIRPIPTFLFLDPWGYKGLSLDLVSKAISGWACECVFFFNYNRVNPGLQHKGVAAHMDAIFGQDRANALRPILKVMCPQDRERAIMKELTDALRLVHGRFVLFFKFTNDDGTRTSHYLIFVTKNFTGYHIMKETMAKESSTCPQGVPSFEYSPLLDRQGVLSLDTDHPLDDLMTELLTTFVGQCLTTRQIYEAHSVGRPYLLSNYKTALRNLEARGCITTDPPAGIRPSKNGQSTFKDNVLVSFSPRIV